MLGHAFAAVTLDVYVLPLSESDQCRSSKVTTLGAASVVVRCGSFGHLRLISLRWSM
jgi:hypothetical protein